MSSAVLSPRTPSLSIVDNNARPRRSNPPSAPASAQSTSTPRWNARKTTQQPSLSPAPTHSSVLSVSSRTRSRASASPDKAEAQSRMQRKNYAEEEEGEDEIDGEMGDEVDDGIMNGEEGEDELDDEMEDEEEEAVEEIEVVEDSNNAYGGEDAEEEEEDLTRPPTPEIEPPSDPGPHRETHRIKLVFNAKGTKRKAEEDVEEMTESVPVSRAETPMDGETDYGSPMKPSSNSADQTRSDEAAARDLAEKEKEQAKRMPRKKRKWLKKGEVDPDDHVAVARQKERHKLIDAALENLDEQYEAVVNGKHEPLVWMLEELERRRDLQLTRLDARYEAEMADLKRMRHHGSQQATVNFRERRDSLLDEMNGEFRWTSTRLRQENILLRVIPNTYSAPRDGRGGGGWLIPSGGLLSLGREKLVQVDNDGTGRMRRDLPLKPFGHGSDTARRDLAAMTLAPKKNSTRHNAAVADKAEVKPVIKTETKPAIQPYPRPAPPKPVVARQPVPIPPPPPGLLQATRTAAAQASAPTAQAPTRSTPASAGYAAPEPRRNTGMGLWDPGASSREATRQFLSFPPTASTSSAAVKAEPAPQRSMLNTLPTHRATQNTSRNNNYAAAPASASYAYQPTLDTPDPTPARSTATATPATASTYTPPMPLYHAAARGDPNLLSWEEYRAYAKADAWGCPLPHDNYRRDLVLRESWEKKMGRIPRDSVPITPFGGRSRVGLPAVGGTGSTQSTSSGAVSSGSGVASAGTAGRSGSGSAGSSLAHSNSNHRSAASGTSGQGGSGSASGGGSGSGSGITSARSPVPPVGSLAEMEQRAKESKAHQAKMREREREREQINAATAASQAKATASLAATGTGTGASSTSADARRSGSYTGWHETMLDRRHYPVGTRMDPRDPRDTRDGRDGRDGTSSAPRTAAVGAGAAGSTGSMAGTGANGNTGGATIGRTGGTGGTTGANGTTGSNGANGATGSSGASGMNGALNARPETRIGVTSPIYDLIRRGL